ncbi:DUF421 domain-containing protein [Peribacillus butanolivorans]|uniref:DUF421 domain-containing protein n=2 Tax=Peribacillus butanolivorans TaxID=421767 RepID=UPI003636CF71
MDISWIWKTMLIVIFGILLIRISGRRSVSKMTTETTVIMIFIGTLLIHPVIGENLWVTFAIATILIGTLLLIEYIQMKWDVAENFLTGKSKIVIENGSINEKNLIKLRLSVDALEMLLRQNGIENIKDVQWATIEPSGQLGYLLTNNKKFATKEDIEKIQHALTQLSTKLNINSKMQSENKPDETRINLFSKIKEGDSSYPKRLK